MKNVHKVALNSLALYANMCVTMLVTLLGTRFVLQALGKEAYGVYALVASLVALFSFLNISMAAATQRYLSYSMGEGNPGRLRDIFQTSLWMHRGIAALVALLLLTIGLYAVNQQLDISPALMNGARCTLLCVTTGLVMTVLAVPYEAAMNAHEHLVTVAWINICEATLKLLGSVVILWMTDWKLETYALSVCGAQTVAFLLKRGFSRKHYDEVHVGWQRPRDPLLMRSMLGFAGWNLIGTGCSLMRYQGVAILLNAFFGLAVNAAYGIAQQVNGFLVFFAGSIVRPLRPQLIKSEGAGEHGRMVELAFTTNRITFLMMTLAVVPLYINMPLILHIWLKDIPETTLAFCRGFLLIVLINQATVGLQVALESVGRIQLLQKICGSLHMIAIPVGYACFRMGAPAETVMLVIIAEEVACLFLRVWIAHRDACVPPLRSLREVVFPQALLLGTTFLGGWAISLCIHNEWWLLPVSTTACLAIALALSFLCYLSAWEKEKVISLWKGLYKNLKI